MCLSTVSVKLPGSSGSCSGQVTEQAHTNTHTPCSSVPGPKLNSWKILLLLRIFITAVLRHVREGIEQERQGATMTQKRQEEWGQRLKEKRMLCKQRWSEKTARQMCNGEKSQEKKTRKKGALRKECWRVACLLQDYSLSYFFLKYSLMPFCLQL